MTRRGCIRRLIGGAGALAAGPALGGVATAEALPMAGLIRPGTMARFGAHDGGELCIPLSELPLRLGVDVDVDVTGPGEPYRRYALTEEHVLEDGTAIKVAVG